jgi:ribosome-associated protein
MTVHFSIPLSEIVFEYARSSGPGGQNVNKTSTKVMARWCVGASRMFTLDQKNRLRRTLGHRITHTDELIVANDTTRSQAQNRENARQRLVQLVEKALVVPKIRLPTRPTKASKVRHGEQKRHVSLIKKLRRTFE